MNTRIISAREFARPVHIRGLTMGELVQRARHSPATASTAAHGEPPNIIQAYVPISLRLAPVLYTLEWHTHHDHQCPLQSPALGAIGA
jgi:hypothetical protein